MTVARKYIKKRIRTLRIRTESKLEQLEAISADMQRLESADCELSLCARELFMESAVKFLDAESESIAEDRAELVRLSQLLIDTGEVL